MWIKESHFPFCLVFIFSYSFSVYVSKLRSNGVQNVISDIFQFGLLLSLTFQSSGLVYFFRSFSMSSKQNKRCPGKAGKSCNKIMPYWDDYGTFCICRVCRNFSCSLSSVCNNGVWTDNMWKFDKCIMRIWSDRAKSSTALSKEVFSPIVIHCQVPKNGPDREIFVLPSVSKSVSATDTRNAVLSENEPD